MAVANLCSMALQEDYEESSIAPERLPDEELVALSQAGVSPATDTLLNRYRHFARAKARTYFLVGADRDDLIQEAMIGLFKAIRDFDPSREVAFRPFAELCIKRQVITAIKGATRHKHLPLNSYVSLDQPTTQSSSDGSAPQTATLLSYPDWDPAEVLISLERFTELSDAIDSALSALEQDVLRLFMAGRSYQEIADVLGRHVKVIDNALFRIKRKLKASLQ